MLSAHNHGWLFVRACDQRRAIRRVVSVVAPPPPALAHQRVRLTYFAGPGPNRLTISQAGDLYTFHDEGALIDATTSDPVVTCSGSGTHTVTVSRGIQSIDVDVGDLVDVVNVQSIDVRTTIDDKGGGDDTVNVGAPFVQFGGALSLLGIEAPLTVMNQKCHTTLNVDDRADLFDHNILMDDSSLFGLAPATILYDPAILAALNVYGGSGANGFIVDDTPTNAMNPVTTLILGSSSSSVSVLATSGPLTVDGIFRAWSTWVLPALSRT